MTRSGVTAEAVIGNPVTGVGADQVRTLALKYNDHDHQRASSKNFFALGVQPGAIVTAVTACTEEIFTNGTTVIQVRENELDCSTRANKNATLEVFRFENPDGTIVYVPACNAIANSLVIETQEFKHGFIDGQTLLDLSYTTLDGVIPVLTLTADFYACIQIPYKATLRKVFLTAQQGSAIAELRIVDSTNALRNNLASELVGASIKDISISFFDSSNDYTVYPGDSIILRVTPQSLDPVINYSIHLLKSSSIYTTN